jgi:heme-degrading monooxygenase HmoA
MYRIIWAFEVKPPSVQAFEAAYGPQGDWATLFRRAPGYGGTELLKDVDTAGRYLTIDHWRSREDFWKFREAFRGEYLALDKRMAALTDRETLIGDFETNGAA